MDSSLETLFYLNINTAIKNWEYLLESLAELAGVEVNAVSKAKTKTWEQFNSLPWHEVVGVSDAYATVLAKDIEHYLSLLFPNLEAYIDVDSRLKSHLVVRYTNGDHGLRHRVDNLNQLLDFIEMVTTYADFYGILEEIQRSPEFPEDDSGALHKLRSSTVEYFIDSYRPTDEELQSILSSQEFYPVAGKTRPPKIIVDSIASALAVKAVVKQQLDNLNIEGVELSVTLSALDVVLTAEKKGDDAYKLEIMEIEDVGDSINLAR